VSVDRTQRKLVKKATSGLAALALSARLADSETLVNKPAWEGHRSVQVIVSLQDIENFAPFVESPVSDDADVVQLNSPGA